MLTKIRSQKKFGKNLLLGSGDGLFPCGHVCLNRGGNGPDQDPLCIDGLYDCVPDLSCGCVEKRLSKKAGPVRRHSQR